MSIASSDSARDLQTVQTLDEYDGYWDSMVELRDGRLFVARGAELMEILRDSTLSN